MLHHGSDDGWRVISAGKCWSFPGQSTTTTTTTTKKKLQNSQPVTRKKTDRRFRPSLTKKEIEVLEEKLQGIEFFQTIALIRVLSSVHRPILFTWIRSQRRNTKNKYLHYTVFGLLHPEEGTTTFQKWVTLRLPLHQQLFSYQQPATLHKIRIISYAALRSSSAAKFPYHCLESNHDF